MGSLNIIIFFFFICCDFGVLWTEKDETKRILAIKEEERRLFQKQFGSGHFVQNKNSAETSIDYNSEYFLQNQPIKSTYSPLISKFDSVNDREKNKLKTLTNKQNNQNEFNHKIIHHRRHSLKKHWCFYCISPWNTISSDMRQVVLNLLDLRRSVPPKSHAVAADCTQPQSLDALQKQTCKYSYCQTLVLTDHDTGSSFTLRGCAENFGAIDEKLFAERGDNTCKKLHDKVDIQECICKNRKYCYAGSSRDLDYTDNYIENESGTQNSLLIAEKLNRKFERHAQNYSNRPLMYSFYYIYCLLLIHFFCLTFYIF